MVSWSPVWAIVLRHARLWKRDINYLLIMFYWPVLDILTWGYLGTWIQQASSQQFQNYEIVALLGVLLWAVVGRGCNIIALAFSEEMWTQNLVPLFSLPLRLSEWICGVILCYVMMITATAAVCIAVAYCMYDVSLIYLASKFFIFFLPLLFSGLWVGFTCLQIMALLGKRGTELGFVVGWFLLPFCGAYYPIEVLPKWGQTLSSFIPMSYVFQGMRANLMHHQDPTPYLIKGYALGILYAALAICLFVLCFNRSKRKGLARLAD